MASKQLIFLAGFCLPAPAHSPASCISSVIRCSTDRNLPAASPAGTGGAPPAPVDIAHKAVVLRCLQAQCEDGQLLVDIFVNYDCDLEVGRGLACGGVSLCRRSGPG